MLTCVYSPVDPMRVVESEEADILKASGVWFDCPKKAQLYREKLEKEIIDDEENETKSLKKSKGKKK